MLSAPERFGLTHSELYRLFWRCCADGKPKQMAHVGARLPHDLVEFGVAPRVVVEGVWPEPPADCYEAMWKSGLHMIQCRRGAADEPFCPS